MSGLYIEDLKRELETSRKLPPLKQGKQADRKAQRGAGYKPAADIDALSREIERLQGELAQARLSPGLPTIPETRTDRRDARVWSVWETCLYCGAEHYYILPYYVRPIRFWRWHLRRASMRCECMSCRGVWRESLDATS